MGRYDPKTPSSFNGLNFVLFLVVAGGGYVGLTFAPHYYPLWEIRGLIGEAANKGYREHDNGVIRRDLVSKAKAANLDIEREDIAVSRGTFENDELSDMSRAERALNRRRGKTITVSFQRYVDVKWLFVDKWAEIELSSSRTVELTQVKW
jgi:hypothetical protein